MVRYNNLNEAEAQIRWYQTNTWPVLEQCRQDFDYALILIKKIRDGIMQEIERTIECGISGRGHIILIGICCAIDTFAGYAFRRELGGNRQRFEHFIDTYHVQINERYRGLSGQIYQFFRSAGVHGWNLTNAVILPQNPEMHLRVIKGIVHIDIPSFFNELSKASELYVTDLETRAEPLRGNFLYQYEQLIRGV